MKSALFAIIIAGLLVACAPTDPVKRYSAAIDRVHANGYPILIFKRSADDALSFINVSSHPVSAVELKLVICASKGETSADLSDPYWLHVLIKGDFQPGFAFNVKQIPVSAIDAGGRVIKADIKNFDWHSRIVAAWVRFADDTAQQSFSSVQSFITPQVDNLCPQRADAAHGKRWLRSLVAS